MQHLNETQRYTIYRMLKDKKTQLQIADYVGVSQAAISKEIARNSNSLGHYSPKDAQMFAQMRKERFRCNRKFTPAMEEFVREKLEKFQWSPEQIRGFAEKEGVAMVSVERKNLRFSPQFPKAFTEKGLYMLATILKSPKAVQTTIAIVEAYAKLKELSRVIVEIPQQEEDTVVQKQLLHRGGQLVEELITDMLPKKSTETSFELNLAMFKFQHSVRRENDEELKHLEQEVERLRNLLDGAGEM